MSEGLNKKALEDFIRVVRSSAKMTINLGILGDKNSRDSKESNASIGATHEFGAGVPKRSFLLMPVQTVGREKLGKYVIAEEVMTEVIKSGSAKILMSEVGALMYQAVDEAFESGGFGQWKPSNMKRKKKHKTLVETQQLQESIAFKVSD